MPRGRVLRIRKDIPATWEEALQQYLYFKQAEGLRPATIEGHQREVTIFFRRHPEAWGGKLKQAVYAFFAEDVQPATYNIRLVYLSSFFKWCLKEGVIPENPLQGFKRRKTEGRVVNLEADTLQRLLTLPDRNTFTGLRDYALLVLTLDTGIRPKEAFSLLPGDINLRSLEVYVRSDVSKTKVSRTLPISPVTAEAIRSLLQARHPSWKDGTPYSAPRTEHRSTGVPGMTGLRFTRSV